MKPSISQPSQPFVPVNPNDDVFRDKRGSHFIPGNKDETMNAWVDEQATAAYKDTESPEECHSFMDTKNTGESKMTAYENVHKRVRSASGTSLASTTPSPSQRAEAIIPNCAIRTRYGDSLVTVRSVEGMTVQAVPQQGHIPAPARVISISRSTKRRSSQLPAESHDDPRNPRSPSERGDNGNDDGAVDTGVPATQAYQFGSDGAHEDGNGANSSPSSMKFNFESHHTPAVPPPAQTPAITTSIGESGSQQLSVPAHVPVAVPGPTHHITGSNVTAWTTLMEQANPGSTDHRSPKRARSDVDGHSNGVFPSAAERRSKRRPKALNLSDARRYGEVVNRQRNLEAVHCPVQSSRAESRTVNDDGSSSIYTDERFNGAATCSSLNMAAKGPIQSHQNGTASVANASGSDRKKDSGGGGGDAIKGSKNDSDRRKDLGSDHKHHRVLSQKENGSPKPGPATRYIRSVKSKISINMSSQQPWRQARRIPSANRLRNGWATVRSATFNSGARASPTPNNISAPSLPAMNRNQTTTPDGLRPAVFHNINDMMEVSTTGVPEQDDNELDVRQNHAYESVQTPGLTTPLTAWMKEQGMSHDQGHGSKTLFGEGGWLHDTAQFIPQPQQPHSQTAAGRFFDSFKKRAHKLAIDFNKSSRPRARSVHPLTVSLTAREQSLLYCELEFILSNTLDGYIKGQLNNGRLDADKLKRVAHSWTSRGRPRVVGFRYDLETQICLVRMHVEQFRFCGPRQVNQAAIIGLLDAMKVNAREMKVHTFCQPDPVVSKHLIDAQALLELLGTPESYHFSLAEVSQFFKACFERQQGFQGNQERVGDIGGTVSARHDKAVYQPQMPASNTQYRGNNQNHRRDGTRPIRSGSLRQAETPNYPQPGLDGSYDAAPPGNWI